MRKTRHNNRHQMSSGDTVLVADKRLKNEDVKVEWGMEELSRTCGVTCWLKLWIWEFEK
jgi:hypothetical protein